MSRRATAARGSHGFTLLELLIVLTIMAMAVALVTPAIGTGLRGWRLEAGVRDVGTLVKFARNQAVTRGQRFGVVLDRSRNIYWLDHEPPVVVDPADAGRLGVRLYALPDGVRFGEVTVAGVRVAEDRATLVFFPRGDSTGGEVRVVDERGVGYRVGVDDVTGRVRVSR